MVEVEVAPGWERSWTKTAAYLLVGGLAFSEAALFVGLVLPS